jgi:hypothetical protein
VDSKASPPSHKGRAGSPHYTLHAPPAGPPLGPLPRTQLPVRHIAHHGRPRLRELISAASSFRCFCFSCCCRLASLVRSLASLACSNASGTCFYPASAFSWAPFRFFSRLSKLYRLACPPLLPLLLLRGGVILLLPLLLLCGGVTLLLLQLLLQHAARHVGLGRIALYRQWASPPYPSAPLVWAPEGRRGADSSKNQRGNTTPYKVLLRRTVYRLSLLSQQQAAALAWPSLLCIAGDCLERTPVTQPLGRARG